MGSSNEEIHGTLTDLLIKTMGDDARLRDSLNQIQKVNDGSVSLILPIIEVWQSLHRILGVELPTNYLTGMMTVHFHAHYQSADKANVQKAWKDLMAS